MTIGVLKRTDGRNSRGKLLHKPFAAARLLSVVAVLATSACSPGKNLPVLPDTAAKIYQLGPGDQVRIITFGEDQLTGDFRVDDTGSIALAAAGRHPCIRPHHHPVGGRDLA